MDEKDNFIKAYHDFRNSVDLSRSGVLPDEENLVWYILMGVPPVPADHSSSEDAPAEAVDQRVNILKAVFVEANKDQSEDFIDEGLRRYDYAGKKAKALLKEEPPSRATENSQPLLSTDYRCAEPGDHGPEQSRK